MVYRINSPGLVSAASEFGAPADEEIEITAPMIKAGLRFLHEAGFPSLTARAESPEFVEEFCRAIYFGGLRRNAKTSAPTSSIKLR